MSPLKEPYLHPARTSLGAVQVLGSGVAFTVAGGFCGEIVTSPCEIMGVRKVPLNCMGILRMIQGP